MTVGPRSQCDACQRFVSWLATPNLAGQSHCAAFPAGIPDRVYHNGLDHRQPIDGDHGIRFEAQPGDEFPEYAFLPEFIGRGGNPA
jgi:hypothetical protein